MKAGSLPFYAKLLFAKDEKKLHSVTHSAEQSTTMTEAELVRVEQGTHHMHNMPFIY